MLDYYLAQYMFQRKCKNGNKLMLFIDAILSVYKPPCKDMEVSDDDDDDEQNVQKRPRLS